MTAISLTSMSIRRADVSGSVQESNNLRPALGGVLHGGDDALRTCDEVHRTTHPRHHFCPGPAWLSATSRLKRMRNHPNMSVRSRDPVGGSCFQRLREAYHNVQVSRKVKGHTRGNFHEHSRKRRSVFAALWRRRADVARFCFVERLTIRTAGFF